MKRLSTIIVMAFVCVATMLASDQMKSTPQDFLDRYQALVVRLEQVDPDKVDEDEVNEIKEAYKEMTKELKQYKGDMTNDQLEAYYAYKARYQKKIAVIKTRRSAKAAKGWVEGMFGK